VEGFGHNIKEFRVFFIKWPAATAWTGWAQSAPSIFDRAAGAVVD
jgi:hypothetical protein